VTALKLHRKVDIDLVIEVESDRNRPASIEVNAGIDAISSPSKDEGETKNCEEMGDSRACVCPFVVVE
jgi:hypothetical protein